MTIVVQLPRECVGQEILEAFRNAATFQEKPTLKWFAEMFASGDGEADAQTGFVGERGVRVGQASLFKRGRISQRLFGGAPEYWASAGVLPYPGLEWAGLKYPRYYSQLTLLPLSPTAGYRRVNVQAYHVYYDTFADCDGTAINPDDEKFAPLRPVYDRVMRDFLISLSR